MLCSNILMRVYWSLSYSKQSLVSSRCIYVIFFATNVREIYLSSVDDRANVDCFFKFQLTGLPFNIKIKLNVNLRLSLSPAEFESGYPLRVSLSWLPYIISLSFELLRYQSIVLTTSVY